MAIKINVQKDFLRTEASISLPASVADVDDLLRATKTNGKMIVLYNQGFIQGINVEQNTKLSDKKSVEIRAMLDISDANL